MCNQVAFWERKPKSQNVYLLRGTYLNPETELEQKDWLMIGLTLEGYSISMKYPMLNSEHMLEITTDCFNVILLEVSRLFNELNKEIRDNLPVHPSFLYNFCPDDISSGTCFFSKTEDSFVHYYEIGRVDAVDIIDGRKILSGPSIRVSNNNVIIRAHSYFLPRDYVEEIPANVFENIFTKWVGTPYLLWSFIENTCDTIPLPKHLPTLNAPERTDFPGDDERRRKLPVSCGRGAISWFDYTVRPLTDEEIAFRKEMMQPLGNIECWVGIKTLKNMMSSHYWEDVPEPNADIDDKYTSIKREDALVVYETYTTYLSEITDFINGILKSSNRQQVIEPQKENSYWLIEATSDSAYRFKAIKVKSVSYRSGNTILKGPLVYWENTTRRLGNVLRVNKTQTILTRVVKLNQFPNDEFDVLFNLVGSRISLLHEKIVSFG